MDEQAFALLLKLLLEKELKQEVKLDGRWVTVCFKDKSFCFKVLNTGEKEYNDN